MNALDEKFRRRKKFQPACSVCYKESLKKSHELLRCYKIIDDKRASSENI